MGNTILFIPALRRLRIHFRDAHIALLVFLKPAKELFEVCPYIDDVQYLPFKTRNLTVLTRVLLRLWTGRFDVSMITFPAPRIHYNVLSLLSGAGMRIAHKYRDRNLTTLNILNTARIEIEDIHDIDQNLNLLRPLGIPPDDGDRNLELWLTSGDIASADRFLKQNEIGPGDLVVGMHPGCTENQPWKRWPYRHFAELADLLIATHGAKVLLFIGPDELDAETKIVSSMKKKPVIVKGLAIREVASVVRRCTLFVSNDSGIMHVAEALNIPTFGIFGPSDYVRMAPYRSLDWVIRQDFECSRECAHALSKLGHRFRCVRGQNICLTGLKPDQVFRVLEEFLASTPPAR
jgi:heptosyltransferase-2